MNKASCLSLLSNAVFSGAPRRTLSPAHERRNERGLRVGGASVRIPEHTQSGQSGRFLAPDVRLTS